MKYSAKYLVFPATFLVISRKIDYLWDTVLCFMLTLHIFFKAPCKAHQKWFCKQRTDRTIRMARCRYRVLLLYYLTAPNQMSKQLFFFDVFSHLSMRSGVRS